MVVTEGCNQWENDKLSGYVNQETQLEMKLLTKYKYNKTYQRLVNCKQQVVCGICQACIKKIEVGEAIPTLKYCS